MIRIKVPMGLLTFDQFRAILDVCDEYSTGKYHLTTRQDIQIHHVKLEDSPELWAKLEQSKVTLREACGNTVRNVTASPSRVWTLTNLSMSSLGQMRCGNSFEEPCLPGKGRKFKVSFPVLKPTRAWASCTISASSPPSMPKNSLDSLLVGGRTRRQPARQTSFTIGFQRKN